MPRDGTVFSLENLDMINTNRILYTSTSLKDNLGNIIIRSLYQNDLKIALQRRCSLHNKLQRYRDKDNEAQLTFIFYSKPIYFLFTPGYSRLSMKNLLSTMNDLCPLKTK